MFRSLRTIRSIPRLKDITLVLIRHGFGQVASLLDAPWLGRLRWRRPRATEAIGQAVRLRMVFQELGPTFIKLGQLLAGRPDLLPADYIRELRKLQDDVPPAPFPQIEAVFRSEIGCPVEDAFASFDTEPIASGSIAQAHRAETKDGRSVVVKIRRPGIIRVVERDMRILAIVAGILADRRELGYLDPVGVFRSFERAMNREMNFQFEANAIEKIRGSLPLDGGLRVPATFPSLSARGVLTMEFFDGRKPRELSLGPEEGLRYARAVARGLLSQVFEHGLYHADPHPGNLLIMGDGKVGLVDFGNVGRLTAEVRQDLVAFLAHFARQNYRDIARTLMKVGSVRGELDLDTFTMELCEVLDHHYGLSLAQIDLGGLLSSLFALSLRYRIALPPAYVSLARMLMTMEGTVRELAPGFVLTDEVAPFVESLMRQRYRPERVLQDVRERLEDIGQFMREVPPGSVELLRKMRAGQFYFRTRIQDLERIDHHMDLIGSQVPLAIVVSALLVSSSMIISEYPLVGLAGYILAAILGLRILFLILRG